MTDIQLRERRCIAELAFAANIKQQVALVILQGIANFRPVECFKGNIVVFLLRECLHSKQDGEANTKKAFHGSYFIIQIKESFLLNEFHYTNGRNSCQPCPG